MSSMLLILYVDSRPSDGHGITRILEVMALMSRSVRAIDCWTVCMTLEEVSFRFLKKPDAPPLIDENKPPAAPTATDGCG